MGASSPFTHIGPLKDVALRTVQLTRRFKDKVHPPLPIFRILHRNEAKFECPICRYEGPFADMNGFAGFRRYATCPSCGCLERHRLQYLVARDVLAELGGQQLRMLHFAPEKCFKAIFSQRFSKYETADLFMKGVNHRVDIQELPFEDASFDFIFASHVLEHIRDDRRALKEIRRVLNSHGVAILPVPVVCNNTIEYPAPNPYEAGHVRAPGLDYFERYKEYFGEVSIRNSGEYPRKYQLFVNEDRSKWPTAECPLRPPMSGLLHADFVPVCYVGARSQSEFYDHCYQEAHYSMS